MFIRLSTLVVLMSFPTGCVVVYSPPTPVSPPAQVQDISVSVGTREPSALPRAVPSEPAKPRCAPFSLPMAEPMPNIDLSDPQYRTFQDVEAALASHIKELRAHVVSERKRLEDAHRAYLDRCQS